MRMICIFKFWPRQLYLVKIYQLLCFEMFVQLVMASDCTWYNCVYLYCICICIVQSK